MQSNNLISRSLLRAARSPLPCGGLFGSLAPAVELDSDRPAKVNRWRNSPGALARLRERRRRAASGQVRLAADGRAINQIGAQRFNYSAAPTAASLAAGARQN